MKGELSASFLVEEEESYSRKDFIPIPLYLILRPQMTIDGIRLYFRLSRSCKNERDFSNSYLGSNKLIAR